MQEETSPRVGRRLDGAPDTSLTSTVTSEPPPLPGSAQGTDTDIEDDVRRIRSDCITSHTPHIASTSHDEAHIRNSPNSEGEGEKDIAAAGLQASPSGESDATLVT